jgi:hypothetical protein
MKLDFSWEIFEKYWSELFYTDRRIHIKLIVAFRNFAEAPKNLPKYEY